MGQPTIESPDGLELRAKPSISARLNKKAVVIIGVVIAGVLLLIINNITQPPRSAAPKSESQDKDQTAYVPALNTAKNMNKDVSDQPVLAPADVPILPKENLPPIKAATKTAVVLPSDSGATTVPALSSSGGGAVGEPRPESASAAMNADTGISKFSVPGETPGGQPTASNQASQGNANAGQGLPLSGDEANKKEPPDPNRQDQKQAFLDQAARSRAPTFEVVQITPPLNEFEVKTGSVIPGAMISHIISDLPGEIVGQVSQNVYDSTTGKYLLIPQGSKLFGRYSSAVTFGQDRVLVVWNRLIFPNGNTMDLSGMSGHDKEGTAGNADLVNNHYMRTFGYAILTSLFSAAFQLSQPRDTLTNNGYLGNQQVVAASVGQQVTQLGIALANRNLQVQPTIEIRKGYQFNIMVNKDLVFPAPYRP